MSEPVFGPGPLVEDPDITPVWFEELDAGGAVIATGMVTRVIYDQAIARGVTTLREVPPPPGVIGGPAL